MIQGTAVRRVTGSAIAAVIFLSTLVFTASPAAAFPVWTDMYIRNLNTSKCLEVVDSSSANGARVQQWSCVGQPGAYWYLKPYTTDSQNTTWYQVVNSNSGKLLEIEDSSTANGARAQQWEWAGQTGALWAIFPHGGSYALRNKASWKLLEIVDSRTDNGAHAQQWSYDAAVWNTQHWFF